MVLKNTERQYNLDLLKALAIICMILCHTVMMFGKYRPGFENEFWYLLGDEILGAYIVVAHGFMFAMGVGMIYSRKNNPGDLIRRGLGIFLLGYVLNFFRHGMYFMAESLITGNFSDNAMLSLFRGDILQFAGLALIVTGIFKKLKLKEKEMLFIALILSIDFFLPLFAEESGRVKIQAFHRDEQKHHRHLLHSLVHNRRRRILPLPFA